MMSDSMDLVFKALADPGRRRMLDLVKDSPGCSLSDLCTHFAMSRIAVMKHLAVLRQAGLVRTREEGRQVVNTLNVVPIRLIYERWVSDYQDLWARSLTSLKRSLEQSRDEE